MQELTHVGFSNFIISARVIAISNHNSAPIRRAVQEASKNSTLIDLTNGRKIKCVIYLDNGTLIVSALAPETVQMRMISEEI